MVRNFGIDRRLLSLEKNSAPWSWFELRVWHSELTIQFAYLQCRIKP